MAKMEARLWRSVQCSLHGDVDAAQVVSFLLKGFFGGVEMIHQKTPVVQQSLGTFMCNLS